MSHGGQVSADFDRVGTMTDRAIADIAASVTRSPDELASVLNIQPEVLHTIKTDYEGVDVVLQILTEWRESDDAINLANGALDELKGFVCS
ncbi:hypothetical protein DPMN_135161 [Dreissena polymorpha]|uniref:Uncharacterized protein n=1 Tax=Dreissena polymorpha TaxID=45954 RepID=A0A9D4G1A6_DREPO|nr:hypothetical protein DPMN_135161 [Dreissena polymorpha]